MNDRSLTLAQKSILEELHDDDMGLWEIPMLNLGTTREQMIDDVKTLMEMGLATLFLYEPPFNPSSVRVPEDKQDELLRDLDSWRLPTGDVAHVRLGLTPNGRRDLEKLITN